MLALLTVGIRGSACLIATPCYNEAQKEAKHCVREHLYAAQADKHSLVDTLGIPYRDLRILDPMVRHHLPVTRTY